MQIYTRLTAKLAVVGSAVYITVDNSIWDKSEYAQRAIAKVKSSMPEATGMLRDVCSFVTLFYTTLKFSKLIRCNSSHHMHFKLPSSATLTEKWNSTVSCAFSTASDSVNMTKSAIGKLFSSTPAPSPSPAKPEN